MKFAFIPKGEYLVGQVITVEGKQMRVEGRSCMGKNIVARSLSDDKEYICILTDAEPIVEIPVGELK